MAKKNSKVAAAFHEVYANEPKSVKKTGKTGEAKRKMLAAVAFSKARAAGAKIPGPEGANYVSRNDLAIPAGASSGVSHAGEHVPYNVVGEGGVTPGASERARAALNQQRDKRTNLGRGKAGIVEVE